MGSYKLKPDNRVYWIRTGNMTDLVDSISSISSDGEERVIEYIMQNEIHIKYKTIQSKLLKTMLGFLWKITK